MENIAYKNATFSVGNSKSASGMSATGRAFLPRSVTRTKKRQETCSLLIYLQVAFIHGMILHKHKYVKLEIEERLVQKGFP
ncbi:hypothetical protein [Massilia sp. TN1-12]|uniref:hypothetical protein n=1 Tax=Massilia paldalensis TaxID=3377675 RepID=UPI00384B59A2